MTVAAAGTDSDLPATTTTVTPCMCHCRQLQAAANLTWTRVAELTQQLQRELAVDRDSLSSTRRRKESAPDSRPSAQASGGLGLALVVLVLGLVVLPDLLALYHALHPGA